VLLHMIRTGKVTTYTEAAQFFPHVATMSRRTKNLLRGSDLAAATPASNPARIINDANGRGQSETISLDAGDGPRVAANVQAKPVVRRFSGSSGLTSAGTCTLAEGVRRCVLGDD